MPGASRDLRDSAAALAVALAALYALWWAGAAPLAPHQVAAALLELADPDPVNRAEAFASLWQFVPFAVLPAACWPSRLRWGLLAAGFLLAALYQIAIDTPRWWLYAYRFLAGAGLVMLLFLAYQRLRAADAAQRRMAGHLLAGALLFAGFGIVTKTYLLFSSASAVPALDLSALQLDAAAFGFSPSAAAVALAHASPVLRRSLAIAYETLPLAMMAVFGLEARAPQRLPFGLLKALFVCGFAAAATYALTPVAGPIYVFGAGFVERVPALLHAVASPLGTASGFSPRNAFPSFHWGWALLAVMLTARFRWPVRALFGIYALAIAFATLALGEHYFVDLVATFPVLLAIAALCMQSVPWQQPPRWQALAAGAAMYLGWALLLQPAVTRLAAQAGLAIAAWCAISAAASVLLYRRLLAARA